MGIFSSLLGAGVSLLGSSLASKKSQSAAQASGPGPAPNPLNVIGPGGSTLFDEGSNQLTQTLSPDLQLALSQLGQGRDSSFGRAFGSEESEVERLRELARPREEQQLSSLRSSLFNRGRLGLGAGGGRLPGFANPELQALQEALATADLQRVGAARGEQQRHFGNFLALQQQQNALAGGIPAQQAGISLRALSGQRENPGNQNLFTAGQGTANAIGGFAGRAGKAIEDGFLTDIFTGTFAGRNTAPPGFIPGI